MVKKQQPGKKDIGPAARLIGSKQAEQALRESEEKYRSLVETAGAGIATIGMGGIINFANDKLCQLTGYSREDIIGTPFADFLHKDDLPRLTKAFLTAIGGTKISEMLEFRLIQKDGQRIWVHSNPEPIVIDGQTTGFSAIIYDISDRKRLEESLAKSEERYRTILDQMQDSYYEVDRLGNFTFVSESAGHRLGYSREEMLGQNYTFTVPEEDANAVYTAYDEVYRTGKPNKGFTHRIRHKDGNITFSEVSIDLNRNTAGEITGFKCVLRDITERKRVEEKLKSSLSLLSASLESTADGILIVDRNGKIARWNQKFADMWKIPEEVLASHDDEKTINYILNQLADPEQFVSKVRKLYEQPEESSFDQVVFLDGRVFERYSQPQRTEDSIVGRVWSFRDITLRRQAEDALRKSEAQYRLLSTNSEDVIWTLDPQFRFSYISPSILKLRGLTPEEAMQESFVDTLTPDSLRKVLETGKLGLTDFEQGLPVAARLEIEQYRKDGNTVWVEIAVRTMTDDTGTVIGFVGISRDISERKQAVESILRSKLLLQSVIDSTPDWMYVKDPQHKFLLVNKSFASAQNISPQDMIGRADTDFFPAELCLGNPDKGIVGFHSEDLRALQGHVAHNPRNLSSWADGSLHIYDTYKIPLTDQSGTIYGVLIYSRDITQQAKAEDERETAIRSLRKTLDSMISTMSRIVEMRDPYTAGHQKRVAELAGAIAAEMKLNDSQIDHLLMAARIHDIGKMYVPSEILNKPGKLADIEWNMIKTHAQGSYDILQDIEFSQPVALMALQHHERLDGSGYPNGLKDQDILLEAKILAVADVIEAMASHRPYRPTLGIDKALEEISQNRGRLYDPGVVDTCLELFKSGRFEFKPA